jgi:hypothetical protein
MVNYAEKYLNPKPIKRVWRLVIKKICVDTLLKKALDNLFMGIIKSKLKNFALSSMLTFN